MTHNIFWVNCTVSFGIKSINEFSLVQKKLINKNMIGIRDMCKVKKNLESTGESPISEIIPWLDWAVKIDKSNSIRTKIQPIDLRRKKIIIKS